MASSGLVPGVAATGQGPAPVGVGEPWQVGEGLGAGTTPPGDADGLWSGLGEGDGVATGLGLGLVRPLGVGDGLAEAEGVGDGDAAGDGDGAGASTVKFLHACGSLDAGFCPQTWWIPGARLAAPGGILSLFAVALQLGGEIAGGGLGVMSIPSQLNITLAWGIPWAPSGHTASGTKV
jgi:hypothetical protein